MLQIYTESDFELNNIDTSRLCLVRKTSKKNSPFFFNFKCLPSFFFLFSNIIEIDFFVIHRFLLVFWLFTGCYGSILKLKVKLRLGVYFYNFVVNYTMKKRKFYYILSFLLDEFLDNQFKDSIKFYNNEYLVYFENLDILTNYKLARGVYFYRIQQKFYLKLSFFNIFSVIFKLFLNSLKFDVI